MGKLQLYVELTKFRGFLIYVYVRLLSPWKPNYKRSDDQLMILYSLRSNCWKVVNVHMNSKVFCMVLFSCDAASEFNVFLILYSYLLVLADFISILLLLQLMNLKYKILDAFIFSITKGYYDINSNKYNKNYEIIKQVLISLWHEKCLCS